MGSRMMHYCIAALLIPRLGIKPEQEREFLLGGVAPDIQPFMPGVKPKDITHFVDRDADGQGHVNPDRFIGKYMEQLSEPFYKGYLCHLLSDVVWNELVYIHVRPLPEEERKAWLAVCYRDFWRLNGRIAEQYGLKLQSLSDALPAIRMDETDYRTYVPMMLAAFERDFAYEQATVIEPLELFENDNSQIHAYIELCVERCLSVLTESPVAG